MTTMTCPPVLLLCVLIGLFTTVYPQRLKPMSDVFEIISGVVIPCGSRCVVQSYRAVLEAGEGCVTASVMEVEQYINNNNNLNSDASYQQIYNAIFSEGRSPVCGWYRRHGGCFKDEFGRICGDGIKNALTRLLQDFDTLICSQNPNYLACVTHPSLLGDIDSPSQSNTGPYVICGTTLINNFVDIDSDNYYQELILRNNGDTLFTALRTFGTCIGDAIKTVTVSPPTGCATVGDDMKKYIVDAINYFDFGQGGKDYVKCFSNNALHKKLTSCSTAFVTDLDVALPGDSSDVLLELNATLYRGQPGVITWAYNRLSSCLKAAIRTGCSADNDSVAIVDRILLPLDLFFDGNSGNDNIQFCPTPTPGNGTKTSAVSLELMLSGLLLLLSVILKLH